MSMESLPSGHAELASHPAARLRRHAEGRTVVIRNHHGLDRTRLEFLFRHSEVQASLVGTFHREEILLRSVSGDLKSGIRSDSHLVLLRELFPCGLGEVCHLVDCAYLLDVQPLCYLFCGKSGKSLSERELLEFLEILSYEFFLHHYLCYIMQK